MAEQRFEGTTFLDAGKARRTMSIDGILLSQAGLALTTTGTAQQVVLTIDLSKYPGLLNTWPVTGANYAKWLAIQLWGSTGSNGNNKQVQVFQTSTSGTKLADSGAVAGNNVAWFSSTNIIPSGVSTADVFGLTQIGATATSTYSSLTGLNFSRGTGLVFVVALTTASLAGDATLRAWQVLFNTEGGIQSQSGVLL